MPELKREKRERRSGSKPSAAVPPPEGGETLFEALRQLRKEIAAKRGVPAYVVLSNTALIGLAEQRPQTLAEAQEVPGIGPVKAQTVIPPFLDVIREWEYE
nr:HRDC domain-containing protein [uncultured Victivallis sp.]